MDLGSWSAYRACLPPEYFGDPKDYRPRPCPPKCDRCGRFISTEPGRYREDHHPRSLQDDEHDEVLCLACAAVTPLPPTPEQAAEHDRKLIEESEAAEREAWEAEAAELAARPRLCESCGGPLPEHGCRGTVCPTCLDRLYADEPPYTGEDIPF